MEPEAIRKAMKHDPTGEIARGDAQEAENLREIIIKGHVYTFTHTNARKALHLAGMCQDEAVWLGLNKLGVELHIDLPQSVMGAILEQKNIRIESRRFYVEMNSWRNGIYLIRNEEIAYFISFGTLLMSDGKFHAQVCTNVPMTESPKFHPITAPATPTSKIKIIKRGQNG